MATDFMPLYPYWQRLAMALRAHKLNTLREQRKALHALIDELERHVTDINRQIDEL